MNEMVKTVRIVIQARVGSSRMPGKILAPLAGEPMLAHVVHRLRAAQEHTMQRLEVMVATTTAPQDDQTEDLCRRLGASCYRGSSEDVLARYVVAVADMLPHDTLLRATADNPLYCPRRTAAIMHEHLAAEAEYTCISGLSYVVPEVVQVRALRRMAAIASDPYCHEHVTPYFRQQPRAFRVLQLAADWQGLRPEIRLTVDTPEEYRRMAGIFAVLSGRGALFSLEDVYAFCSFHAGPLQAAAEDRASRHRPGSVPPSLHESASA